MATPPHHEGPLELHIRHMPGGVFTDRVFGATDPVRSATSCASKGRSARSSCARTPTSRSCCLPSRHRLRADQGDRRALGVQEPEPPPTPVTLYWGVPPQARPVPAGARRAMGGRAARTSVRAGAVGTDAGDAWTGRTGFVHRAVIEDLPDLLGLPGVRVRRAGDGRVGATRFHEHHGLPADEFYADASPPRPTSRHTRSRRAGLRLGLRPCQAIHRVRDVYVELTRDACPSRTDRKPTGLRTSAARRLRGLAAGSHESRSRSSMRRLERRERRRGF